MGLILMWRFIARGTTQYLQPVIYLFRYKYYAHKTVLVCCSLIFRNLILDGSTSSYVSKMTTREAKGTSKTVVDIYMASEVSCDFLEGWLKCIYSAGVYRSMSQSHTKGSTNKCATDFNVRKQFPNGDEKIVNLSGFAQNFDEYAADNYDVTLSCPSGEMLRGHKVCCHVTFHFPLKANSFFNRTRPCYMQTPDFLLRI